MVLAAAKVVVGLVTFQYQMVLHEVDNLTSELDHKVAAVDVEPSPHTVPQVVVILHLVVVEVVLAPSLGLVVAAEAVVLLVFYVIMVFCL